jgi:hypothetical protein
VRVWRSNEKLPEILCWCENIFSAPRRKMMLRITPLVANHSHLLSSDAFKHRKSDAGGLKYRKGILLLPRHRNTPHASPTACFLRTIQFPSSSNSSSSFFSFTLVQPDLNTFNILCAWILLKPCIGAQDSQNIIMPSRLVRRLRVFLWFQR